MSEPFEDPVVGEIHKIREKMLADANGDIDELIRQVAERQRLSTHRIISLSEWTKSKAENNPEHTRR